MRLLYPFFIFFFIITSCMHESITPDMPETDEAAALQLYENQLKDIIEKKCLSCHNYHQNGDSYYNSFLKVKAAAGRISERVFSDTESLRMPPVGEPVLTNEEKNLFSEFFMLLDYKEMEKRTKGKIEISWTGYKYPQNRVGVTGRFDEIEILSLKEYDPESPLRFLEGGRFSISTNSANIGDDSLRTTNIRNYFFRYMAPEITGEVIQIENDTVTVNIKMNFITQPVDFYIESLDENVLTLAGRIENMNDFNWKIAHDNLGRVCGQLHRDYLWEDIDLRFQYNFE